MPFYVGHHFNLTSFLVITPIVCLIVLVAVALGFRRILRAPAFPAAGLPEWARLDGLSFDPERDYSLALRFPFLARLQRSRDEYVFDVMYGTVGKRPVCAFEYHYAILRPYIGYDRLEDHFLSAVVVDAGFPLKRLSLRPGGFLHRVTRFVDSEHVNVESAEFSRRFRVKSPYRQWARDVLNQKAAELMLAYPRFHIEFQGTEVVAYYDDRTFSLGEFSSALRVVTGILDNLPDSVVQQGKSAGVESRPS